MDAFRIAATDVEAEVTDMMVAEQTLTSTRLGDTRRSEHSTANVDGRRAFELMLAETETSALDGAGVSRDQSTAARSTSRGGGGGGHSLASRSQYGDGSDDDADEITSDDSGDFEALTSGLDDAAGYDLVRAFIAFGRQQERDIEALVRECEQLEGEQNTLWRRAVAAEQLKQRSGKQHRRRVYGRNEAVSSAIVGLPRRRGLPEDDAETESMAGASAPVGEDGESREGGEDASAMAEWSLSPVHVHDEVIDEEIDEFEDVWLNTERSCRYMDPESSYNAAHKFRYAEPDHVGDFVTVFDQGFLYRAVTPEGAWVFYNDSEKYMMNVKYRFGATSTVTPGPKALVKRLPSGEIDVEVAVAPEETQILIFGEANGFRSLSVAVPVTEAFTNTKVELHNASMADELHALAAAAHVSNIKYLSPEDALKVCRRMDGAPMPFVDPSFPPCSASLYRKGHDSYFLWSEPWRRPDGYMSATDAAEVRLFRGLVSPYDPCPGDGGDVYLCSAAAILAEYPMLVRALFRYPLSSPLSDGSDGGGGGGTEKDTAPAAPRTRQRERRAADEARAERRVHAYRVTLNHGGWWRPMLLDDYLPASRKGPAFGRCEDDLRKLWFPLLQKAYAKAHGSYAAIQCGDVAEALQDLTGFPTSRFDEAWAAATDSSTATESSRTELFEFLREQRQRKGYAVCLSLPDEGSDKGRAPTMGLVYGMSYYVMDMVEHRSFDAGTTYRLVQLRCPTARPGWDGMWCPESIRWQEEDQELRRLCSAGAGGGVWLDWAGEVLPMFEGGCVCHLHPGMHDYRIRGEFNDGVPSVAVEVEVRGGAGAAVEMYCTLSQMDDRDGDPDDPASALSPLMLCVSKPAPLPRALAAANTSATAAAAFPRRASRAASCGKGEAAARRGSRTCSAAEGALASGGRRQVVDCVCSTNPDTAAEKLNFVVGRDVSLRYTFTAQTDEDKQEAAECRDAADADEADERYVYYIIPRARGAMQGKAFTLGLLCRTPIDEKTVRVNFVQPSDRCEVFRNKQEFDPARLSTPLASVNFQSRDPMGIVTSAWGSHISSTP